MEESTALTNADIAAHFYEQSDSINRYLIIDWKRKVKYIIYLDPIKIVNVRSGK